MKFLKLIAMFFLVVLTSMFFFPFEFTFLPGVNTKMALAAVGLVLFGLDLAKGRTASLSRSFFLLSLLATLLSLVAFASAIINNTNDYTYASYIVSMWVWMGGAYVVVFVIRSAHGEATVENVGNYLIAVCVMQCILAMLIDRIPAFEAFISRYVYSIGFIELEDLKRTGRLYGVGCALDVAGSRFSCVLGILAAISTKIETDSKSKYKLWLYLVSFFIISIIGCLIARTTYVGITFALIIWLWYVIHDNNKVSTRFFSRCFFVAMVFAVLICVILYNFSPVFKSNIQFGFEGFFSLAEKGYWETNSNNILKQMVIFPDNAKTWLIGDGYFDNPFKTDPNYVGENFRGFYKATDIGYLRFIFSFGIIGLLIFCMFMIVCALSLCDNHPNYRLLFLVILAINYIVWFKVSTDIFPVFAMLLAIPCGRDVDAPSVM